MLSPSRVEQRDQRVEDVSREPARLLDASAIHPIQSLTGRQVRLAAMLDHVGLEVSDFDRSKAFYEAALAPLGISCVMELDAGGGRLRQARPSTGPSPTSGSMARGRAAGQWRPRRLRRRADRETVDAFHAAALAAGGTDNGAPGPRPIYHPGYYGACRRPDSTVDWQLGGRSCSRSWASAIAGSPSVSNAISLPVGVVGEDVGVLARLALEGHRGQHHDLVAIGDEVVRRGS